MDPLSGIEPVAGKPGPDFDLSSPPAKLIGGERPLFPPDLSNLEARSAWVILCRELAQAVGPDRNAFYLFSIATVKKDGSPDSRTVVLREFSGNDRLVWFHTDVRSEKMDDLRHNPRVVLLWYDPMSRCQIRIKAKITIHHLDKIAQRYWDDSQPISRGSYGTTFGPGMVLEKDFPPSPKTPESGNDRGFANFVAVCCHFDEVDWLYLRPQGHQRVRISFSGPLVTWKKIAP